MVLSRSEIMARVRGKDTKPEWRVRAFLHAAGLRYRLHVRTLPGCPDLVFPSRRCVVFIHGCFWHRHPGCSSTRTPKSRADFWERKFLDNVQRDERVKDELRRLGWKVLLIWECETRSIGHLRNLIEEILKVPKSKNHRSGPNNEKI